MEASFLMLTHFPAAAEYKLSDLLSSAGATIGIIIAGTIFLQFLSTKYLELSSRYRELTKEYRGNPAEAPRHDPLRAEIGIYRQRLRLINRASWLAAVGLLSFLLAVLAGGLSMVYPPVRGIKVVGSFGLFAGLLFIAAAVCVELWESILARRELHEEVADLDEDARAKTNAAVL